MEQPDFNDDTTHSDDEEINEDNDTTENWNQGTVETDRSQS